MRRNKSALERYAKTEHQLQMLLYTVIDIMAGDTLVSACKKYNINIGTFQKILNTDFLGYSAYNALNIAPKFLSNREKLLAELFNEPVYVNEEFDKIVDIGLAGNVSDKHKNIFFEILNGATLNETAEKYGISHTAVDLVYKKCCRLLKHPVTKMRFLAGIDYADEIMREKMNGVINKYKNSQEYMSYVETQCQQLLPTCNIDVSESWLDTVSSSTKRIFERLNVRTYIDASNLTVEQILSLSGIGPKKYNVLKEDLARIGVTLHEYIPNCAVRRICLNNNK